MTFLHRSLSEDHMINETSSDSPCYSRCINDLRSYLGSCSTTCIKKCYSRCKIVVVTTLSPPPPMIIHKDLEDNLQKILLISASSIFTTLFLLALLVVCIKLYNKRRLETISRRWNIEEEASNSNGSSSSPFFIDHPIWHIRTIGLNPMVISSIKVCKYSKKEDCVVDGTDCSVCLSEFEEEEMLRLLPKCKHAFHLSCIDTWLRSHTTCPICRAPIVVTEMINDEHREVLEETHVRRIQEENEDIDESDHDVEERDEFVSVVIRDGGESDEFQQRVRRSMSLDSRLSHVGVGREKEKRGNIGSSIVGRSSFLRRTISYSGK